MGESITLLLLGGLCIAGYLYTRSAFLLIVGCLVTGLGIGSFGERTWSVVGEFSKLGHEIGYVIARHSAQRMAKLQITQGLSGAVLVASGDSGYGAARIAATVGHLVNMKFGRDDELQSDNLGVRFMSEAGYDPRALIRVMEILAEAGGGRGHPEFFSTHPNPDNRVHEIEAAIALAYPDGVPDGLVP